METKTDFSNLNEKELKMLCLMAFNGETDRYQELAQRYRKATKMNVREYDSINDKLISLGYLKRESSVDRFWHVKVMKELYANHSEWIKPFRNISSFFRSATAEYLFQVVRLILEGDYVGARNASRPGVGVNRRLNVLDYFRSITTEDMRFLQILDDKEMRSMMGITLETLFFNDELTQDILKAYEQIASKNQTYSNELLDEISAYRYLMYATPCKPSGNPTFWSECTKAMQLMYKGKPQKCIEKFEKILDGTHTAFEQPVFNYVYGIALCWTIENEDDKGREAYLSKLKNFLSDFYITFYNKGQMIASILECLRGKQLETEQIKHLLKLLPEKIFTSFAFIIYHLCEMPTEMFTADMFHSSAFIQHEISTFFPIGFEAKRQLCSQFGGPPILSQMHRQPSWEKAFADLETVLSKNQNVEKRIAYYVIGNDLTGIREQVKLKGHWHNRKVLDWHRGLSDILLEDNADILIATHLKDNKTFHNGAKMVVPLLADSERIFYGEPDSTYQLPVVVHRVKPMISFTAKGAMIEISSNVPWCEGEKMLANYVESVGKELYNLISLNALQKDLLIRFLRMKQIPSSAVLSLKKNIDNLKGILEVNEKDLELLMQPAILSEGMLSIRIVPALNGFDISVFAVVSENGEGRFVPSDGESLIYELVDGTTYCFNRNLNQENSNYKEIKDYLEKELEIEFTSYTGTHIDSPEALLKLMSFVYDHQKQFFMEWPEGARLKLKGELKSSDIDIFVASNKDWFSIEGEVQNKDLHLSLSELIAICCSPQIEGFIKISEDEYVRMSEQLKKHIAALAALPTKRNGVKAVPKYQVGALASVINGLNVHLDETYRDFEQKTKAAYALDPPIPKELKAVLRDYQVEGFRWMCRLSAWGAGACLADDMGLGKTLQAIAFLLYKANEGPSLVVAPKSVLPNWQMEIARFAPTLNTFNLNTTSNRRNVIENAGPNDVVVSTYGVLGTERDLLTDKKWNVVCLDEAHQIKNRNTIASDCAMDLVAENRVLLTGTPLQNNLGELWNLFQFANPGLLGPWGNFKGNFMAADLDESHRSYLKEMITPFILRRTKQEVLAELPEKIIKEHIVELSKEEMDVYEEMRRRAELKFKSHKSKSEKEEANKLNLNFFAELMKLRLAACSMKLVYETWNAPSSKVKEFFIVLDSILCNPENNVLVFSQFTSFFDVIKAELKKKNIDFLYIDGQTSLEKRQQQVEDFQTGRCRLFLSSLKAGGIGINLTAANYVILLDPWWNPAIENQAMDRAHRLGQERMVCVIRMISAHTIEEKILHLHQEKQSLTDDILDGTGDSSKLTYEDIIDMVSPF